MQSLALCSRSLIALSALVAWLHADAGSSSEALAGMGHSAQSPAAQSRCSAANLLQPRNAQGPEKLSVECSASAMQASGEPPSMQCCASACWTICTACAVYEAEQHTSAIKAAISQAPCYDCIFKIHAHGRLQHCGAHAPKHLQGELCPRPPARRASLLQHLLRYSCSVRSQFARLMLHLCMLWQQLSCCCRPRSILCRVLWHKHGRSGPLPLMPHC